MGTAGHVHQFLIDLNGIRAGRVGAMLRNADCITAQVSPPRPGEFVMARDECNELYPAVVEAVGASHLRLRLVAN